MLFFLFFLHSEGQYGPLVFWDPIDFHWIDDFLLNNPHFNFGWIILSLQQNPV